MIKKRPLPLALTIRPDGLRLDCGDHRLEVLSILEPHFSYLLPGREFVDAFIRKQWDGVVRLLRRAPDARTIIAPRGALGRIMELAKDHGWVVERDDLREPTPWRAEVNEWTGPELFPFQVEAVEAAVGSDNGGILNEPIRSGKTMMAAAIAHRLKQKTLFIAPSDFLVAQARDVFRSALRGPTVTVVGLGQDDLTGDVVIASLGTLAARKGTDWWGFVRAQFGLVIIDEIHHLLGEGEAWREVAQELQACTIIGLSGTLDVGEDMIRMTAEAICGPVLHRTAIADLAALGRLVPCHVTFHRYETPALTGDWRAAKKDGVTNCTARNQIIIARAMHWLGLGKKVLVDVGQIGHGRLLFQALNAAGMAKGKVRLMVGNTEQAEREQVMRDFRAGKVMIIISTVLGEGVDIPDLEVVINAEGGADSPSTIQRLRQLTPFPGKQVGYLDELVDVHHPSLAGHTRARLKVYRSKGFTVVVK